MIFRMIMNHHVMTRQEILIVIKMDVMMMKMIMVIK